MVAATAVLIGHDGPGRGSAAGGCMRSIFSTSTAFYDALYGFKDDDAEAAQLHALIEPAPEPAAVPHVCERIADTAVGSAR